MSDFAESIRKLLMAGVGAAAITAEKAKELLDVLSVKGEEVSAQGVEKGKEISEDLKRKLNEVIGRVSEMFREGPDDEVNLDELLSVIGSLTGEQRAELLGRMTGEPDA